MTARKTAYFCDVAAITRDGACQFEVVRGISRARVNSLRNRSPLVVDAALSGPSVAAFTPGSHISGLSAASRMTLGAGPSGVVASRLASQGAGREKGSSFRPALVRPVLGTARCICDERLAVRHARNESAAMSRGPSFLAIVCLGFQGPDRNALPPAQQADEKPIWGS